MGLVRQGSSAADLSLDSRQEVLRTVESGQMIVGSTADLSLDSQVGSVTDWNLDSQLGIGKAPIIERPTVEYEAHPKWKGRPQTGNESRMGFRNAMKGQPPCCGQQAVKRNAGHRLG